MDIDLNTDALKSIDEIQKDIPTNKWKQLTTDVKRRKRRTKLSPIYRDKDGDTLLHILIAKENKDVLAHIEQTDIREINAVNILGQTPMHIAVYTGNVAVVGAILNKGVVDLERYDCDLNSPVHLICERDCEDRTNIEIARLLLTKYPANKSLINSRNEEGFAPLHLASKRGNLEMIKLLVNKGADIDIRDGKLGNTCLMMLIKNCSSYDTIEYVVESLNADVNVKSFSDNSPIHCACSCDRKDVVKLLLKHGSDVGEKNINKRTEKDLATDPEIKKMIDSRWRKKRRQRNIDMCW